MASPVDFISGERYASMPLSFSKENAGALTYHLSFSIGIISVMPWDARFSPIMTFVAILTSESPVDFDRNGTLREALGFTSIINT